MVVFMNPADAERLGLEKGDVIDLTCAIEDGVARTVRGFQVYPYDIPEGCVGAYYPEANPLVPLDHHDAKAMTPAYKAIPVRVSRSMQASAQAAE